MNFIIQKCRPSDLDSIRHDYLNSLPEFQELFLEWLVAQGSPYLLQDARETAGYAVLSEGALLTEFFLKSSYHSSAGRWLQAVIQELAVKSVYCKSFDPLLLNSCRANGYSSKTVGILYRGYAATDIIVDSRLQPRRATIADYELLLQQPGDLYETPAELTCLLNTESIQLFYRNDHLVGCGFKIHIHKKWNYYDIGMWVHPDFRRQGIAPQIIAYLKAQCLADNQIPICGCEVSNLASQKTLERNGFVGKHQLLEFSPA